MEAEIKKFLYGDGEGSGFGFRFGEGSGFGFGEGSGNGFGSRNGSGYGSGNGYGYGSGSGCGNGFEFGEGSGSGFESGSGSGSGCGNGFEFGEGSGSGFESGSGSGSGFGFGFGEGSGFGFGEGSGSGYGSGFESGSGIRIKQFKGRKVYYVDTIPCIFKSVHENYASVETIDVNSLELKKAFIGKFENCFAHGNTIRDAIEDARSKYYQSLDFDEAKEKLRAEFKEKGKLTVKELYNWHGILTGSCRFGRTQFQTEHNLKDDDLLTLEEFVELTKNAFGGDKIVNLK